MTIREFYRYAIVMRRRTERNRRIAAHIIEKRRHTRATLQYQRDRMNERRRLLQLVH